jgi:TFIIF-interacting CTD phosphatase-like protein
LFILSFAEQPAQGKTEQASQEYYNNQNQNFFVIFDFFRNF